MAVEDKVIAKSSQPACQAYEECLDVMYYATDRLDLPWRHEKREIVCGRLDKCFLSGHNTPTFIPCLVCALDL